MWKKMNCAFSPYFVITFVHWFLLELDTVWNNRGDGKLTIKMYVSKTDGVKGVWYHWQVSLAAYKQTECKHYKDKKLSLLPGSAVWLPLLLTLLIMLPKGHKLLEELFLRIFAEPDLSREVNLMTFLAPVCSRLKLDFFSTAVKSSRVFQVHPNLLLKI